MCQESRTRPRVGTSPRDNMALLPPRWRGSRVTDLAVVFSRQVMSDSYATLWIIAHQPPLSMGFPRQEYWSGLSLPSPGDLPNPGIEPESPELQIDSLPLAPPRNLCNPPSTLSMTGPRPLSTFPRAQHCPSCDSGQINLEKRRLMWLSPCTISILATWALEPAGDRR